MAVRRPLLGLICSFTHSLVMGAGGPRRNRNCCCKCRTSSHGSYPVSNKTQKQSLPRHTSNISEESKVWAMTRTGTPEPFQSQGPLSRKIGAENPLNLAFNPGSRRQIWASPPFFAQKPMPQHWLPQAEQQALLGNTFHHCINYTKSTEVALLFP